jgi:RNA polymerase sigma-70 factor (ECF subfamily)
MLTDPVWKDLRAMLERFVSARVARPDAEDILQEALVRVSRGLPRLREGARLGAWVHQIARNTIADHYRNPISRRACSADMEMDDLGDTSEPEPAAALELAALLSEFVRLLPSASREALELTHLRGVTQTEAARRLGLSVPGMKSRVQRARAQLRDLLDACCDIETDVRGRVVDFEPRNRPAELPTCCSGAACVQEPRADTPV